MRYLLTLVFALVLAGSALATLTMLPENAVLRDPEHIDLKLDFPFNQVEGPVLFGFEYRDGQVGRAHVAGLPGAMQGGLARFRPDLTDVTITPDGITGVAKIGRVKVGTAIAYYSGLFTLDVKRRGRDLAGMWTWRNGVEPDGVETRGTVMGERKPDGTWGIGMQGWGPADVPGRLGLGLKEADGKVTYTHTFWFSSGNHQADVSGLKVEGNRLTGTVALTLMPDGYNTPHYTPRRTTLTLDITADDKGALTGTFVGRYNQPVVWTSTVTGRVLSHAEWLARNQVAVGGPDWPSWMGPNSDFRAGAYGQPLVDRLDDSWLVWRGDTLPAGGRGSTGTVVDSWPNGGGGSPVVRDGRVYLYYYVPGSGAVMGSSELNARMRGYTGYDVGQWRVSADEVVLCMDAATGRTLWKQQYRDTGVFHKTGKRPLATLTPVVFNSRVYAVGTSLRVFCLDAVTGEPLWESGIGDAPARAEDDKLLAQEAGGSADAAGRCSALSFCEKADVLISNDFGVVGGMGLVAFDGKTGKQLWVAKGVHGNNASPIRWLHDGREYVVAVNHAGEIRCLEPRTGKQLWMVTGAEQCNLTQVVQGDYLLTAVPTVPGKLVGEHYGTKGKLGCWQLSLDGAKLLWTAPQVYTVNSHYPSSLQAVVHEGRVYYLTDGALHTVDLITGKAIADMPIPADVFMAGNTMKEVGRFSVWENRLVSAFNMSHERQLNSGLNETRKFTVIDLLPDGPRVRESYQWPHQRFNSYEQSPTWAYVDGRFFVRGEDAMYCYDLRKAEAKPSTDPGTAALPAFAAGLPAPAAGLASRLADERAGAVVAVAALAGDARAQVLPHLATLATAGDWEARLAACAALKALGPDARGVAGKLATALRAEVAGGQSGRAAVIAETLAAVDADAARGVAVELAKTLAGKETGPRDAALTALGALGRQADGATPQVADLLAGKDAALAAAAARVLGAMGPGEARVTALAGCLKAADRRVKVAALTALQGYGEGAASAVPVLLEYLKAAQAGAGDPVLVARTLSAIVATGKAAEAAVPTLDVLGDPTSRIGKGMLVRMLVRIGPASVPALRKGLAVPALKYPVICALGRLSADPQAREAFLEAMPFVIERAAQPRKDDGEYYGLLETVSLLGPLRTDPRAQAALKAIANGKQDAISINAAKRILAGAPAVAEE